MRLQEIIGMLKEYFFLAFAAIVVLGVVFFIGYTIINRKFLGGKGRLPKKQLLVGGMLIGYIIMVMGVTFLSRGSHYQSRMELSLFSSYREAWFEFTVRQWQFLYLNILMFIPFGILLPLYRSRFKKAVWTIGAAALFTLAIECIQLITGFGIFDIDDLFNNLLGGIIGYGIVMGIINIKEKRIMKALSYFAPLLLVLILSGSVFTYYHFKEFGNLAIMPVHKINMKQVETMIDIQLDDQRKTVPVYKAPSYTKKAADEFAEKFFRKMNMDTTNMEVISYPDDVIYRVSDEKFVSISFNYLDGSYSYTDFSSHDEDNEPTDVEEEILKEKLRDFDIQISQDAEFEKVNTGSYVWTVDKKVLGDQLIDGSLGATYYKDGTVKQIDNRLITYDKVKDIEIKSEQEAYEDILKGKFQYYPESGKIETMKIHDVELSYYLDSKGYYQPVFAFDCTINGNEFKILMPGI
ncbi:VanZ family protein [Bacillus niameyensis]|uniref:VanZ family protein n=1 Tax=Bacillus niameyensis TaxID=1522308 RepID=UPI00078171DB|nr:VanZ family protein [Bacillus niameyensis]